MWATKYSRLKYNNCISCSWFVRQTHVLINSTCRRQEHLISKWEAYRNQDSTHSQQHTFLPGPVWLRQKWSDFYPTLSLFILDSADTRRVYVCNRFVCASNEERKKPRHMIIAQTSMWLSLKQKTKKKRFQQNLHEDKCNKINKMPKQWRCNWELEVSGTTESNIAHVWRPSALLPTCFKRNRITGSLKRSYQKLICLLALIN